MKPTLAAVLAALLLAAVPTTASAASLKAKVSLARAGASATIEVKLTSSRAFTAKTRPRGVKVGAIKLSRVAQSRKAATWRSAALPAAQVEKLAGTRVAIKVTTRAGTRTLRGGAGPLPPAPATPTPPATATPPATSIGQATLTRDDAAGHAALGGGDLLLEWASFGSSGRTAEYRRIWFMADGTFRRTSSTGTTCQARSATTP